MTTETELTEAIYRIVNDSVLEEVTVSSIRKQLQEEYGEDMSARKNFIKEKVMEALASRQNAGNDSDDDDSSEEEEEVKPKAAPKAGTKRKAPSKAAAKGKKGAKKGKKVKKKRAPSTNGGGGLQKPMQVSAELAQPLRCNGGDLLPRTEVVKKLWEYIRAHNLQDPKDKRQILCDELFRKVFDVDSFNMFQMNKYISQHLIDPDDPDGSKKEAARKEREANKGEGGGGGLRKPMHLSADMSAFIGGDKMMARTELVKKLWEYIRKHDLQDPEDRRNIKCDQTFKDLFDEDYFTFFQMNKLISRHLLKPDENGNLVPVAPPKGQEEE